MAFAWTPLAHRRPAAPVQVAVCMRHFLLPMPPARGVPSARGWLRDAEWFLRGPAARWTRDPEPRFGVGRIGSAAAPQGRRPHLAEMRTELLLHHIAARPEARPAILRFLEDAARARAAWETGLPVHLLDPGPDGGISIVSSPGVASLDPEATTLWMGMGPPPSWLAGATWSAQQDARARAYWVNPAFRTLAGRSVVRAEGLSQLCLELAAMAREGRRRAFVKACAFKRGTSTVPLAGVRDPRDAWRIMAAACGEETLLLPDGARSRAGWRRSTCRCGRKPASSPWTDASSGARPCDARMRSTSTVAGACLPPPPRSPARRDGLARAARFAREAVAMLGAVDEQMRDFVLDVAENQDGENVLIEVNPLGSSGLCGLHPRRVARALLAAAGRACSPDRESWNAVRARHGLATTPTR